MLKGKKKLEYVALLVAITMGWWATLSVLPLKAQLANGPWPTFKHDARHTGRSPYAGPGTNELIWRYLLPAAVIQESPVLDANGTIYLPCGGTMFAINPNGSLKWKYVTPGGGTGGCAPALAQDGTVYIPSGALTFYAFYPSNIVKWFYQSDGASFNYSSPCVGVDGMIYVGCGLDLLALKPDGKLYWKYRVGEETPSSPALGPDGTIYIRGRVNYLCAVNPDGSEKWRLNLDSWSYAINVGAPVIEQDGTIYTYGKVGDSMGLYAINPDKTVKWTTTETFTTMTTPCLGSDGTIYVVNYQGLTAISNSGVLVWRLQLPDTANASSPVIDKNDTIYLGAGHKLYAVRPDKTIRWTFEAGNKICTPAIGADGKIYFGAEDGYLYAVGRPAPAAYIHPGIIEFLLQN
jgi:outer membrane protein assembly factor BamB